MGTLKSDIKNCENCRFYFLHMQQCQGDIIVQLNPEWRLNKCKEGYKLCTKNKEFHHPKDYCGGFMDWYGRI